MVVIFLNIITNDQHSAEYYPTPTIWSMIMTHSFGVSLAQTLNNGSIVTVHIPFCKYYSLFSYILLKTDHCNSTLLTEDYGNFVTQEVGTVYNPAPFCQWYL